MTPQEIEQLKSSLIDAVQITVKTTVNGKIDGLTQTVAKHIADDTIWKSQDAKRWKAIDPVIRVGQQAIGTGKTAFWLASFFGAIGTFIVAVVGLVKWILTMK